MKALCVCPSTQLIGKEGEANDHLRNLVKDPRFLFLPPWITGRVFGKMCFAEKRGGWGWECLSVHILTYLRANAPLYAYTTIYHYNPFSKWRLLPFLSGAFYTKTMATPVAVNFCSLISVQL